MDVPYNLYFIALSMITAFAVFSRRGIPLYLRLFPYFLLVTLVTEILGWYLANAMKNNAAIYNFFSVAAFIFYSYVIMQVIYSAKAKRVIRLVIIIYTIVSLFNILFVQKLLQKEIHEFFLSLLKCIVRPAMKFYQYNDGSLLFILTP